MSVAELGRTMDKRSREWVLLCALIARQMPPTWLDGVEPGVPA
jgi:hypothetical protein